MLLVCMTVAAAGGVAWEHRPPIGWHAKVLFWRVGFDLPDGLATQRDKALAAASADRKALGVCQNSARSLEAAVAAQNSAVEALGAQSARRAADLARGLQATAGALERAARRERALDFTPRGATVCERYDDVDRHVLEALR